MTTDYAIKCLKLMGWEIGVNPGYIQLHVDGPREGQKSTVQIMNHDAPDFTIEQLTKREDVMERVVQWLNESTGYTQWDSPDMKHQLCLLLDRRGCVLIGGSSSLANLLTVAEVRGITPEQLLGVKG